MINNIKNKVAPYEHEGRWFKAFIEKDENGELKLTRCDLPGAELTENGLKLPEGFHAVDYTFDTHYTAPALLTGPEHTKVDLSEVDSKIANLESKALKIVTADATMSKGADDHHFNLNLTSGTYTRSEVIEADIVKLHITSKPSTWTSVLQYITLYRSADLDEPNASTRRVRHTSVFRCATTAAIPFAFVDLYTTNSNPPSGTISIIDTVVTGG